jgi:hypothetical protein
MDSTYVMFVLYNLKFRTAAMFGIIFYLTCRNVDHL